MKRRDGAPAARRAESVAEQLRIRFPRITGGVILVQVGVYAAMALSGPVDQDALVAWGAKAVPLMIDAGQLWRLLTANFVHESALHIGFNLFVLFNVGGALEHLYRPLDYGLLLLASALGTTLVSLWALPEAVTAGSSGMVFGAMGAGAVFGVRHRELLPARYQGLLQEATIPAVLVFLYIGFTSAGVDNWAHLGGLVGGAGAAALVSPAGKVAEGSGGRWILRASPFALVAAGVGVGGALLARGPGRMQGARDDAFGVEAKVPALWRRGAERFGQLAFSNGLAGLGRASFTAGVQLLGPGGLEGAAKAFVERELGAEVKAGGSREVRVEAAVDAVMAGRPARRLEARYVADGAAMLLRAYFVPRGELVYELVYEWPERYAAYERRVEEMEASVRLVEPRSAREARGRALLEPSAATMMALGATLGGLGEAAGAQAAAGEAVRRGPGAAQAEGLAALAAALLGQGRTEEGCRAAQGAAEAQPEGAMALEALADCAAARQDWRAMRSYLERAAAAAPSDERLRARLGEERGGR